MLRAQCVGRILRQQTYTDTQRWLPHDDPWRSSRMKDHINHNKRAGMTNAKQCTPMVVDFINRIEEQGPPTIVTTKEQIEQRVQYQTWLGKKNKDNSDGDPSQMHGVKRKTFYMICHIGRYLHLHFYFSCQDNTMQIIQCKNKYTLHEITPAIVIDLQINFVTICIGI